MLMLADSAADLIVLAASTYTGCTIRNDVTPGGLSNKK